MALQIDTLGLYTIGSKPICFSKVRPMSPVRSVIKFDINDAVTTSTMTIGNHEHSTSTISMYSIMQPTVSKYAMVTWDAFYNYVFPMVQGCPVSMVEQAIKSACIEFCEKTGIWKQDSTLNSVYAGMSQYSFAPPSGAKVVAPYRIEIAVPNTLNKQELTATSLEDLESFRPNWRTIESEVPDSYLLITDDTVRLIGIPTQDIPNSLLAGVMLKPTREATACPNFIYEDWAEVIAAGALARLHANKNKVWAITELVQYYQHMFKDGITRAKSKAAKSWLKESKNILPVGFTNTKGYK